MQCKCDLELLKILFVIKHLTLQNVGVFKKLMVAAGAN